MYTVQLPDQTLQNSTSIYLKAIISLLNEWTAMYAYGWQGWRPRKDTTTVYLALLSRWFWLGKQALVLGHIVWLHLKARRTGVPARMHRNKRPGQGWTPPQRRQEREQNGGKEWAYLEKAECTHTQLQAPHYPITPSVFFSLLLLLRDAQQVCVDEKARAQQLSSPINPAVLLTTCSSRVISTCGT